MKRWWILALVVAVSGLIAGIAAGGDEASAATGCTISVGSGASGGLKNQIVAAYNRNGGKKAVGCPINEVHRWGSGHIQDFKDGTGGRGGIMRADGANKAFWVHGAIWATYAGSHGGAPGLLGYPTSDEANARSAVSGSKARTQKFDAPGSPNGGMLVWWKTGLKKGKTYAVHGATFNTWRLGDPGKRKKNDELGILSGLGRSLLGLPISNEFNRDGGRRQRFEGGFTQWQAGSFADVTYQQADRFRMPVRGSFGAAGSDNWYSSQVCGDYYSARNGYHLGDDLNWGSEPHSDVGKLVVSSGAGRVRLSSHEGGWGYTVVVESAVPIVGTDKIQYVTNLYAHLGEKDRKPVGAFVHKNDPIGRIGSQSLVEIGSQSFAENGGTPPHLHWAVKKFRFRGIGSFGRGYTNSADVMKSYLQPKDFKGIKGVERYNKSPDCYWGQVN